MSSPRSDESRSDESSHGGSTLVDVACAAAVALLVTSDRVWFLRWLAAFGAVVAIVVLLAGWVFSSRQRGPASAPNSSPGP